MSLYLFRETKSPKGLQCARAALGQRTQRTPARSRVKLRPNFPTNSLGYVPRVSARKFLTAALGHKTPSRVKLRPNFTTDLLFDVPYLSTRDFLLTSESLVGYVPR